jgi:predicted lysophospholipase L1 biosynthesis ABC-type transport system permease subunit
VIGVKRFGERPRPALKLRSVALRNSQEVANHGERQGIGKVVHEIDFSAAAHFADEIVDDRFDTAVDRPHPLRGELGHDKPAQDGVIGRIAKNQGTMRFDDPILDRIGDKVPERIAGPCMLGLGKIVRT